jgi:Anti-sigma-K factor rskA
MEANSGAVLPPSLGASGAGALSRTGNGLAVPTDAAGVRVAEVTAARAELGRAVELPPEGRLSATTLATLAAAAGVVAILVGGWAFVSGVRDGGGSADADAASPPTAYEEALALLADPGAERLPLAGSVGRIILVVRPTGDAALVLNGLGVVDSGWAYQAWVSRPNALTPLSAALFSGREAVVRLSAPVPRGATVAVTLEPAEGSFAPTRTPKLVVQRPA